MKICIMSRKEIEAYSFDGPLSVAICIAYPTGRLHKVEPKNNLLAVHHARFSDCDAEGNWTFPGAKDENNKPIPMTRGQAFDIIDFVLKWHSMVEVIYIACYGGISRSAGIGAGLCALFGWDDSEIYKTRIPNAHCKKLIQDWRLMFGGWVI